MKKFLTIAALAALVGFVSCNKEPDGSEKISVSPRALTFSGAASQQKVVVKTSCSTYTAVPDASWLSVSINGKELLLSAEANTEGAERSCKVLVSDAVSSCEIDVTQTVGSPVEGYEALKSATAEYGGKMPFVTYPNETYGGCTYFTFEDLNGNTIYLWLFTKLFASADEVEIVDGTYTVGEDEPMTWYAVPGTWFPGSAVAFDEEFMYYGSHMESSDGSATLFKSGTVKIQDGVITIDMKDRAGNEYKYAYSGEIELEISAVFGGASDPTQNIYSVTCDKVQDNEDGTVKMMLTMNAGNVENPTRTMVYFNVPGSESGDISIAGSYSDTAMEGVDGTVDLGYYVEFDGLRMAFGTSVVDADFNMWAADGTATLMIVENEDGTYMVVCMLADKDYVESEGESGVSYRYMLSSTAITINTEIAGGGEEE